MDKVTKQVSKPRPGKAKKLDFKIIIDSCIEQHCIPKPIKVICFARITATRMMIRDVGLGRYGLGCVVYNPLIFFFYLNYIFLTKCSLIPKKIPHTGDTESLDRC